VELAQLSSQQLKTPQVLVPRMPSQSGRRLWMFGADRQQQVLGSLWLVLLSLPWLSTTATKTGVLAPTLGRTSQLLHPLHLRRSCERW
jgi:hypothetical protein